MEYSRPQADYFVESYDTRGHMIQQNERQKAYVNRQRQQIIAEELSELEKQEYREDIVAHMEQLEVKHFGPDLNATSANGLTARNSPRCYLNRYPSRNTVVHASLPA